MNEERPMTFLHVVLQGEQELPPTLQLWGDWEYSRRYPYRLAQTVVPRALTEADSQVLEHCKREHTIVGFQAQPFAELHTICESCHMEVGLQSEDAHRIVWRCPCGKTGFETPKSSADG
jgi:hypothetical protein